MWQRPHLLALLLALGACTQFPELDAAVSPEARLASPPELLPLEPLLAARATPRTSGAEITQSLENRVSALRNRAARLRGAVIDPASRARLRQQPG